MDRIGRIALAVSLFFACLGHADEGVLRLLTYNILYDNPRSPWSDRVGGVSAILRHYGPDIFGVQEALQHMISDIQGNLPEYSWVGAGREDGKSQGEYSALFFRSQKFELLEESTFWLSSTPEVPGSRGWGAHLPRVATWALLRDKATRQILFVMNTHFDHQSALARQKSAELVRQRIGILSHGAPVILMGDFNSDSNDPPYLQITGDGELRDSRAVSSQPPVGPDWTFQTVFGLYRKRIDFIFATSDWRVLRHETSVSKWQGDYPSDHLPVLVDVKLSIPRRL